MRAVPVAIAMLLASCGGNGNGGHADAADHDAADPDAPVDAAPARPLLASGGVQLLVTGPHVGLQITPANLADDTDVLEVHQEFYGVPWDELLAHTSPPAAWTAQIHDISTGAVATGKPIFLSISMLNGGRTTLAAKTFIDGSGNVQSADNWAAHCYDFATASDAAAIEQAYFDYIDVMVDELHPTWLNIAIEVNLFAEACPAAMPGLVAMYNAAYAHAKALAPSMLVFPSFQIDHLYGFSDGSCPSGDKDACFDANYSQIAGMTRDRFAMSSYPIPISVPTPAALPADWFTKGAAKAGEVGLIAETGMDDTALVIDVPNSGCFTAFTETQTDVAAYLARVLGDAKSGGLELVNWWSDRDLVDDRLMADCPCSFDATWCAVEGAFRGNDPATQAQGELALKAFGTMGLRGYDGTPKPMYSAWAAARE